MDWFIGFLPSFCFKRMVSYMLMGKSRAYMPVARERRDINKERNE